MKALVIGGSGQIGGWLLRHLESRGHQGIGTYATVEYPGLVPMNAADREAAASWVRIEKPDVVFYPAGFTWVDGCEKDPAKARASNLEEPLNLGRAARDVGARFVYYSTDYIFDGVDGPFDEQSEAVPPNIYGEAKREAEEVLLNELGDRVLVARTSWVYGPERQGKNFAYQLVRTLRQGKPMTVPSDQRSNPSYGPDVALASIELVEKGVTGLIHVAGPEVLSRPEFAVGIARGFDLDEHGIQSKPTSELAQGARRPLNGGLKTDRLESILPGRMRPLQVALADFRETLGHDPSIMAP